MFDATAASTRPTRAPLDSTVSPAMRSIRSRTGADTRHRIAERARTALRCAAFAAALSAALLAVQIAGAQERGASAAAPASTALLIRPGVYRIGAGAVLRVGTQGLVVVDANRAGTYDTLMTEIRRIAGTSGLPLRALVLTGAGPGQAAVVAQFVAAGVPVIAHRRMLARLVAEAPESGAAMMKAVVTYDNDYLLRVGEVQVEIEHVGSGKSDSDSIVLFRELRVVAVGDLFTTGTPEPDCTSGGSLAGWAAEIGHLLWSDFDLVMPSRGVPVGKPELAALKEKLDALARGAASAPSSAADCRTSK